MTSRNEDASAEDLVVSPFLHEEVGRLYNPLTDADVSLHDPDYACVHALARGAMAVGDLDRAARERLNRCGWLVPHSAGHARGFRLKYVSLETHTVCNQSCYFCPVSIDRRASYFMPTELFERIVAELADFRETIDAVATNNYNEPTLDRRFLSQIRTISEHGLAPAIVSNGWGLTPEVVDELEALGTVRYLVVNLSTLDPERYRQERGAAHLGRVVENLEHLKDRQVAAQMKIVVLGRGDEDHQGDFDTIAARFEGSRLDVEYHQIMDRAGHLPVGLRPSDPARPLRGCENVGSRPLQHIHITPYGKVVLCCEDYDERYPVGDLNQASIREVLEGEALARYRRWIYGLETAPDDFICRRCVFALRG